ncbi:MAG: nucleoside-diphosphate kinase [Candidatus Rhabdochlamydia sp.]
MEKTLSILKPDAVQGNHIGEIIARFEKEGLSIAAMKMTHLSTEQAKAFYAVHEARPFYGELVQFMTEGPVVILVLEGENSVMKNRAIMGATNPKDALAGTIRKDFATSIDRNAVHGSDSLENAGIEIAFFFPTTHVFSRA